MYQDYNNMYNQYYGFMEPPSYRHYQNPQTNDEIVSFNQSVELIRKSITNEHDDDNLFEDIIKNAPSEKEKKLLISMKNDTKKHIFILKNIYYKFTGQMLPQENYNINPTPPVSPSNNSNNSNNAALYREKLEKTFLDNLDSIINYRRIMGAMPDEESYVQIMSILTDKIRHSNLYNYLICKAR
ncbi:MAG: hypothetical protein Q4G05_03215 [Clostridia bacterium]|nr:hypothetical protein [Clostridia bacterium]